MPLALVLGRVPGIGYADVKHDVTTGRPRPRPAGSSETV